MQYRHGLPMLCGLDGRGGECGSGWGEAAAAISRGVGGWVGGVKRRAISWVGGWVGWRP